MKWRGLAWTGVARRPPHNDVVPVVRNGRGASTSQELARFAATHASWTRPGITMEDLMVSVADKTWKNKRVPEPEDLLVARLAQASGRDAWEEFLALDGLLQTIGDHADERLAFQAAFPIDSLLAGSRVATTRAAQTRVLCAAVKGC